jgi:hypothetical protein
MNLERMGSHAFREGSSTLMSKLKKPQAVPTPAQDSPQGQKLARLVFRLVPMSPAGTPRVRENDRRDCP